MNASALFEKTLQGYSRLSSSDPRSLTKYCTDHHVNIRAFRYWMKKHSIAPPKRTRLSHTSSFAPLAVLPCSSEERKSITLSDGNIKNVQVSFAAGSTVSIGEITCQNLIQIIHALQ